MEPLIFIINSSDHSHLCLQKICITNAMQKLGVKGRSQAVVELLRMGELEL
ncbi:spore gernimation protein [Bacillus velezensis]|nr:spore gernimation protein [Bacillus velezensis]PJN86084.1 spore gernimation protein [Bacillus velezensis]QEK97980.1 DNA-binding response regulator [Bacillus amyloliquefaciens]